MTASTLIRTPDEITGEWLAPVLGLEDLELGAITRIGTGQMSQSHRVEFTAGHEQPGSVVVKLASDDPKSRATGVGLGAYLREISFYRNLAARIGGPVVGCHLAEYDDAEGWFTLVLQDIEGAAQGDQIAGCSVEQARLALTELARIHAPVLNDLALGTADWLNQGNPLDQALVSQLLPGFLERYGDRVAPEHIAVCERFVQSIDGWAADARPPLGLVHADYRLDNLLFGDGTCHVVDWQTVTWGPAMLDASYFLGGGLSIEDRRAHEEQLIRVYHDELLAQGVEGFAWETCWSEYRRQVFHGVLMAVAAAMLVVQTERGDEMFMTLLARHAQQAIDLDSLALLPEAGTGRPPALQPDPADEERHAPGVEAAWNESWYFDGISDDGSLGVYVRLGRVPNQGTALYTAAICGPRRPSVMVVDADAPLPDIDDEAQTIDIDGLHAEQHCEEALQRFRVTLEGRGEAHADESAPLRNEHGEPVEVALDLVWETDGIPYAWRQSTRYEIPCRVTGTVRVGDEEIAFSGPGQRDHSWGARDWWATDWMWNAFHFEDGTHTHAVGIPQMPGFGVGYVQRDGEISEIQSVTATEEIAGNGLIRMANVLSGPDPMELTVEPLAFGALRLVAPDGRVTHFPRAMCSATDTEGRRALGWMEWNRNQH
jgi:hypothetical protein